MNKNPIVIIGGGISGLAVAWFLHVKGISVQVLESRSQVGGAILTSFKQGFRIEHGPNSTLQKPGHPEDSLGRLIQSLGLDDRLQVANKAAERRYIARDGLLKPLPTSPPAFFLSSFFSWKSKARLLAEPFISRALEEESIATFVRRRLGTEFLDYVIEPFISGVYAGDPESLSVRAAVAKIYALERDHGSLIGGALRQGRALKGAGMPKGRMISFDQGMGVLPETIAKRLSSSQLRTDFKVTGLEPGNHGQWQIYGKGPEGQEEKLQARLVVLAVPASVAANLIAPFASAASRSLRAIPYAPIASVALGYRRSRVGHPLDGFGFLVPRREKVQLLGGLFSSSLFPDRATAENVLLTAFIGGAMNPQILDLSDQALVGQVERDLDKFLQSGVPADFVHLTRYLAAIPQYTLGHLERVSQVDAGLANFPGIHLRANWRDGISVGDCIRNGERLAEKIVASFSA